MGSRAGAIARATGHFDGGGFRDLLAGLVSIPSTSQEAGRAPELRRYLKEGIGPWLRRLGFTVAVHPNPAEGFGPILSATRVEDPGLPTALLYGYSI